MYFLSAGMAVDPSEAELHKMSTLTEEGVMTVKQAACDRLLASRVETKMQVTPPPLSTLGGPLSAHSDREALSSNRHMVCVSRKISIVFWGYSLLCLVCSAICFLTSYQQHPFSFVRLLHWFRSDEDNKMRTNVEACPLMTTHNISRIWAPTFSQVTANIEEVGNLKFYKSFQCCCHINLHTTWHVKWRLWGQKKSETPRA